MSYSGGVNIVFMYLYCHGNGNGISRQNTASTLVISVSAQFFSEPQEDETFLRGTTKKCENKNSCHFLFQLIISGCLGQEELIKSFLLGFS